MQLNKLQGLVILLVFVSMLIGVGVLTLDKFSRATRTTTTITDADVNVSSGAATLSETFCLGITTITNKTGATEWAAATYNVSFTNADTCVITSDLPVNILYNVTYTYGETTEAQVATDNSVSAITPIASTWMALIVTVAVLAIIMALVIGSFVGVGKR